jgi:hypothetical protein
MVGEWSTFALGSTCHNFVCIGRSFSSSIRRAGSRCRRRRRRSARRVRGACSAFLSSTTRAARRRSRPRAQKNRNLDIPCLYSRRRGHAHEPAVDGEQALARFREAATAGQPLSLVEAHAPPPLQSKASLKAWWNTFSLAHSLKKDTVARAASAPRPRPCAPSPHSHRPAPPPPVPEEHPVFGKPLRDSHKYASVQISTANASGELYVWGYIAVVVAKWCVARARRACPCSRPPARSISRKTNPVR